MNPAEQYTLRWNNYLSNITCAFDSLRKEDDLVDVTLICDGRKIHAHKVLLSACSPFFKEIFKENPCQHPIIVLRNVPYEDLSAIIRFMYQGEVSVVSDQLNSFLATAEYLAVRGLTDDNKDSDCESVHEESEPPPPETLAKPIEKPIAPVAVKRLPPSDHKRKRISSADVETGTKKKVADKIDLENDVIDCDKNNYDFLGNNVHSDYIDRLIDIASDSPNNTPNNTEPPLETPGPSTNQSQDKQDSTSTQGITECLLAGGYAWSSETGLEGATVHHYPCTQCGKVFRHPDSLRQHQQAHTGNTKCPICDMVLSRKFELKVHMRKRHRIAQL